MAQQSTVKRQGQVKVTEQTVRWHWHDSQVDDLSRFATVEPQAPSRGAAWFDAESGSLYVWDGDEWTAVPLD